MTVRVRLFAILKERAGTDEVEVDLPDSATVADAIAAIARLPGLGGLSGGSARMAVNREYAAADTRLGPGDELALIPPVSGGEQPDREAGHRTQSRATATAWAAVRRERLELEHLIERVQSPHAGAIVSFHGLPRDIPVLEYEAYAEMALTTIHAILEDCVTRHGLCAVAAEHRVGPVAALEPSIIVVASAPHRGEAFAGAREALDRIKAQAPIWKVEVAADGARHRVEGVLPR